MKKDNKVFREYVTSTAFNLSLSANMIMWLVHVKMAQQYWLGPNRKFIVGLVGLKDRGLVTHNPDAKHNEPAWAITEAGEKVLELLIMAGLVPEDNEEKSAAGLEGDI